jgi:carboxypeptidase Taq
MSLSSLKNHVATISHLRSAAAVLEWDQETYMPDGAVEARAAQVGTLRSMAHTLFTDQKTQDLIHAAQTHTNQLPPDDHDRRLVEVINEDFTKAQKLSSNLVAEKALIVGLAKEAWKKARQTNNFSIFSPHLEKVVDMNQRWADALGFEDVPYDALLDQFEPKMKTKAVAQLFADLRTDLVPMVHTIAQAPLIDDTCLHLDYDTQKQWDFGMMILNDMGYDFQCGRQDISSHPFTTTFDVTDVRVTTRIMENYLPSALFSTMHEGGHALYEQGVHPKWASTPLAEGTSLGMHESQSRLWENQVGRSHSFWQYALPKLKALFPSQLSSMSLDSFYRAINKVQPSLIRVEADEVTYPLHIMLRFELENALLEGEVQVKDLPEIWREKMRDYLGVVPETDTDGVLQDIHWSLGEFGYFPTYALGTLKHLSKIML